MKSIYEETVLIPKIIADCIGDEAQAIAKKELPGLTNYLVERAETIYKNNARFRRQIRGESGRDCLYMFMRHWAAGWLFTEKIMRLSDIPSDFKRGLKVN